MRLRALAEALALLPPGANEFVQLQWQQEDEQAIKRIETLGAVAAGEIDQYLSSAQGIIQFEAQRRAGAESRATTFIAAVATLVPLMTWALSNASPTCEGPVGCSAWSLIFDVAVAYFVVAAYWSLRTLQVSTFYAMGAEDLVEIRGLGVPVQQAVLRQTLSIARRNQESINRKMDFIRTAQKAFFIGLFVLASLLALDPWVRFPYGHVASRTVSSGKEAVMATNPATLPTAASPTRDRQNTCVQGPGPDAIRLIPSCTLAR